MIRLRTFLTSRSRHGVQVALLASLAATILLAHSAAGMGHDAESQADGGHSMDAALSMCLAITEIAGAAVLLRGSAIRVLVRFRRARVLRPLPAIGWVHAGPALPSARAGPAALQVFRR